MDTWLLIFFTITGSGGSQGNQPNYLQFQTQEECLIASKEFSNLEQSGLKNLFRPQTLCIKNGFPISPSQGNIKK